METGLPEIEPRRWPTRLLRWSSAPLLALVLALAWDGASAPTPAFRLGVSDESGWLWQAVSREVTERDDLHLIVRHAPRVWQSPAALHQALQAGELDGWLALPADPLGRVGATPPTATLHSAHPYREALAAALQGHLSAQVSAQRRAEAQLPKATVRWAQAPLAVQMTGNKPPPPVSLGQRGVLAAGLLLALLLQIPTSGRHSFAQRLSVPLGHTGLWAALTLGTFYALRLALAPTAAPPWPPAPVLTLPELLILTAAGLLTYALYGALGQLRHPWAPSSRALGLTLLGLGGLFALGPAPLLAHLGEGFLWCPPLALFGIMALAHGAAGLTDVLGPLALLGITTLALGVRAHRAPRPDHPQPPPLENAPP